MKVELIDVFGSDNRVCDAARVSFNKLAENYTPEQNSKLIQYLAKHNHWSPFAHVSITMREKVPIFVARQRFKHRIGFEYNEVSRRYVDDPPEFFIPQVWRSKPENAKQGSGEDVVDLWSFNWHDEPETEEQSCGWDWWSIGEELKEMYSRIEQTYKRMVEVGVAPEQARMILPQSLYTEYIVTGSLAAWSRAYKLRIDEHSQLEIRELAKQWNKIITSLPELEHSWRALTT